METTLQVLLSDEGTPAERLDELAGRLRRELLLLDVGDVVPLRTGKAPPGARGVGAAEIGALLVSLSQSTVSLATLVETVRAWRSRSRERPSVKIVIDGDVLEISEVSSDQAARAFELFADRHAVNGDRP
ncbi:hypothetical protein ABZ249_00730 [Nocardiopsis sp. NPDC006139]|uniref:effector-associated constant component EACC1 n=1 Tax=Nocardiopsis sp. NPDC006139 TaxID=3154578 RepID=UPI0033BF2FBD